MVKEFELLAPAGSLAILKGVIEAGADAVYIGGSQFGARAYADNFSEEELLEALDFAHLRGKKVYLTINTLLKNTELMPLYEYLTPLYEHGLDAVIVQDLGVISLIRDWFGDMPVHASTQMTVTGVEGVKLLQELGVSRVVLSRELSIEEIQRIHERTGMELEVFVHGALCYCYSGQCLFSSMLGGRSGNRGRCAQPCRLPYSVWDEEHRELRKDSYILSLKDLCAIEHLPQLLQAGAYSLKIEGRMKQISYAVGVVSYYRKYIDACLLHKDDYSISQEEKKEIADLGSRCGFTDSYLTGRNGFKANGSDMVTYEKPSFYASAEPTEGPHSYLPIQGRLVLKEGIPARLELQSSNILDDRKGNGSNSDGSNHTLTVNVTGDVPQRADKQPLVEADVMKRMQKTKDTAFVFETLTIDMEDHLFLPNGALNRLRREGIAALEQAILLNYYRQPSSEQYAIPYVDCNADEIKADKNCRIICAIEQRFQLDTVLSQKLVTTVYLSSDAYSNEQMIADMREDIAKCHAAQKEVFFIFPAIFRDKSAEMYARHLEEFQTLGLDGVVVKNYEALHFVKENLPELRIVSDYNLYTYNDAAVTAFHRLGVWKDTIPLELNRKEIRTRHNNFSEMLIYGYYPLMVSAQCVRNNCSACRKETGFLWLKDRLRKEFAVRNCCNACYNVLYNSLPTLLFLYINECKEAGITDFRLHFTIEEKEQVQNICKLFEDFWTGRKKTLPEDGRQIFTNGHYKRGVE